MLRRSKACAASTARTAVTVMRAVRCGASKPLRIGSLPTASRYAGPSTRRHEAVGVAVDAVLPQRPSAAPQGAPGRRSRGSRPRRTIPPDAFGVPHDHRRAARSAQRLRPGRLPPNREDPQTQRESPSRPCPNPFGQPRLHSTTDPSATRRLGPNVPYMMLRSTHSARPARSSMTTSLSGRPVWQWRRRVPSNPGTPCVTQPS